MSDQSLKTSQLETARPLENQRRSLRDRLASAIPLAALASGILLTIAWSGGIAYLASLAVLQLMSAG